MNKLFSVRNLRGLCGRFAILLCAICSTVVGLAAQQQASESAEILAEETEPLVLGKEGRNYLYKNLFRKGYNYYENFTIEAAQTGAVTSAEPGRQVRIRQKKVAQPNLLQFMPEFSQQAALLADSRTYAAGDFGCGLTPISNVVRLTRNVSGSVSLLRIDSDF